MCNYTSSYIKVDLCAHTDSKNGIFTRRVYSAYILTRTPSPFSAGSSWGLLSRKIFYFFLNPLSTRSNYTSIFIFFWFSLVSLRSLDWNYFFEFYTRYSYLEIFFIFSKHCFNSSSFHSVFLINFYLFSFYTRLITILSLLRIVENYDFDIISRFRIFDSEFRLVSALQILHFNSSTLYLSCLL